MDKVILKFLDMLRESVILQSFITSVFVGVCGYLWLTGQTVPEDLQKGMWLVLGVLFGAKTAQFASRGR